METSGPAGAVPTVVGARPHRSARRILVVDDEADIRELVEDLLEPSGFCVSIASDYASARAALAAGGVDLAVLDVMGVRGYELLAEFGGHIPCVMLTGKALNVGDVRRAYDDHAVLYVPKDRLSDLPDCIARVFEELARARPAPAQSVREADEARRSAARALWRWFVGRVDLGAWLGRRWGEADPAFAAEVGVTRLLADTPELRGLPAEELRLLSEAIEVEQLPDGAVVCKRGELEGGGFCVVAEGAVRVERSDPAGAAADEPPAALLSVGAVFGGGPLVLRQAPASTVRAHGPTRLYRVAPDAFRALAPRLPETVRRILRTLQTAEPAGLVDRTVDLVAHLDAVEARYDHARHALELAERQRDLGRLLVALVGWLALYAFLLAGMRALPGNAELESRLIEAVTAIALIVFVRRSGLKRSEIGLTWKGSGRALWESLAFTVLVAGALTVAKKLLMPYVPAFQKQPWIVLHSSNALTYAIAAPIQELIGRGAILTTLDRLLVGRHRRLLAIVVSSLIFGSAHLHLGIALSVVTVVIGFAWGWLYTRHRTLTGISLSHFLLGVWTLDVLGGRAIFLPL